ncbi:MAG: ATP-binding protein [Flavobacteriaceae bacterium]
MKKLLKHISKGESEFIEFKTSFNKETIETLVAFSNAKGGEVFIGVSDKKEIIGVSISEESIQQWMNQIKHSTFPQLIPEVEMVTDTNKTVIVFKVSEFPIKPVSYKNKYYRRVANANHVMTLTEISAAHLKTMNSSWDYYPDPNHNFDDILFEKVTSFINKIEERTDQKIIETPLNFLKKLEVIRNEKLTFGAYLLFAKEYCAISDIQIGRFKSDITIIDSLSLDTDLFSETEQLILFIKKHLMVEYIITDTQLPRIERYDYPLDAIREIVVNMIVHRDYRDSSASIIKIYDDRIEFFNPGKLVGGNTLKGLLTNNYTSKSRNKLIAKAFKEVGLIERYGSGIKRILNICFDYGVIAPIFEEIHEGFKVVLFKEKLNVVDNVVDDVVDNVVDDTIKERRKKIIKIIEGNNRLTAKAIAKVLGTTERTIQRDLKKMKELEQIERIGADNTGYWQIINKNLNN